MCDYLFVLKENAICQWLFCFITGHMLVNIDNLINVFTDQCLKCGSIHNKCGRMGILQPSGNPINVNNLLLWSAMHFFPHQINVHLFLICLPFLCLSGLHLFLNVLWTIGVVVRMSILDTKGWRFEPQHQYVFSLSKILYPHCFSRLSCEMSTRWGQPRKGCSVLWALRRNST